MYTQIKHEASVPSKHTIVLLPQKSLQLLLPTHDGMEQAVGINRFWYDTIPILSSIALT